MAVKFSDSFDHYVAAQFPVKWSVANNAPSWTDISAANGRNSTAGLLTLLGLGYVYKDIAATATLIVGVGFKTDGTPAAARPIIMFTDAIAGGEQISVRLNVARRLEVNRNGTVLATGATILSTGVFYFIEFKATIHNTTGAYTLRINGVQELDASGVNTRGTGTNNTADRIQLGSTAGNQNFNVYYDDFYFCDTTGPDNTDFLGDIRVQATLPNANGATSAWLGSDGNSTDNYLLVDEASPNGDTDYVTSGTVGQVDTYGYGNLVPSTGSVKAIQMCVYARKDDAGTRTIAHVIREAGVDYAQANLPNLSTSYQYLPQVIERNPATGLPWTVAEVNADEFGVKVVA